MSVAPPPNALFDASVTSCTSVPASFTNGIVLGVNVSGVSLNVLKVICPPTPNTAYSSVKFSLDLRNDSLILSPVPSFPSTPMLISCFAIYCSISTGICNLSISKFTLTPQPQLLCAFGLVISNIEPIISFL